MYRNEVNLDQDVTTFMHVNTLSENELIQLQW